MEARVRPQTRAVYRAVLLQFLAWVAEEALAICSPDSLDDALVEYAEQRRTTRSRFECLVSAVRFFLPRLPRMAAARATMDGWARLQPCRHTAPMLRVFALALAMRLAALGCPEAGALLIVQQVLLLRPGEALQLRVCDVTLPEFAPVYTGPPRLYCALGAGPWGTKVNRRQVVSTLDPIAVQAARRLFLDAQASGRARLVGFDYQAYRQRLAAAADQLGWADLHFRPHSPRAGGATQLLFDGVPFPEIQRQGRWAVEQSCRRYLDAAFALAAGMSARATVFLPLLRMQTLPGVLGAVVD
jgi:integrase